jgi:3-hydroxyisobutyrate dehydrogenase-like beta-hydroxyacid dehydrogenase
MIQKAAFIGLGVMGAPMAGHLQRSGLDVTVYNRTTSKAQDWARLYTGHSAATPREAAQDAQMIALCVGNDDDIRSVMLGPDGILAGAAEGSIVVDHTTASADVAREMAALAKKSNVAFLDAPVSGGQAGAEKGQLTIMAGGDTNAFNSVEPVLRKAYAKEIRLMGPSGSGQLTKMINQVCIAGVLQGLSEGLAFGMKAGLDMDQVLAVIGKGAAQSWQMDNRGGTMVKGEFDFGFAVQWMIKDLGLVLDEAEKQGISLDLTKTVLDYYRELDQSGDGRKDTSVLIKRLL